MPCRLLRSPDFRGIVNKCSFTNTSGRGAAWLSPPQSREAVKRREQMMALIEYESHVQILRNVLSEETEWQSTLHDGTGARSPEGQCADTN